MKINVQIKLITTFIFFGILFAESAFAANPVVFFSDMTDAPTTGWENSSVKGAAVSIWGRNFGFLRGQNFVTVGGISLVDDSDYAEWGVSDNPKTARGLQRITFYLNSNMNTAGAAPNTTIKLNIDGEESEAIPFHCRSLDSNHIYFISTSGSDTSNGLMSNDQGGDNRPWATPGKARLILQAGDIAYFRTGTWGTVDPGSSAIVKFSNNHNNGESFKSITWSAYPTEVPIFQGNYDDISMAIHIQGTGEQLHYYTFSKLTLIGGGGGSGNAFAWGANYFTQKVTYLRVIGNDMTTRTEGKTIFAANGHDNSHHYYIYGNYLHDAGVENRGDPVPTQKGYGMYLGGYGDYSNINVGWNESCYNSNGKGIQVYGHYNGDSIDNLYIHDNWFHHNSDRGMALGGGDNGGGGEEYYYIKNLYAYNNIIEENGSSAIQLGGSATHSMGDGGNYFFYNNTTYNNGHLFDISPYTESLVAKNNIFYEPNFFGRNAAIGVSSGEKNIWYGDVEYPSWDINYITTNPLFTNVEAGDFTSQSNSSAINTGVTIREVAKDFLGLSRPQGSGYDIGAFEYDENTPADTVAPNTPSGLSVR